MSPRWPNWEGDKAEPESLVLPALVHIPFSVMLSAHSVNSPRKDVAQGHDYSILGFAQGRLAGGFLEVCKWGASSFPSLGQVSGEQALCPQASNGIGLGKTLCTPSNEAN